MEDFSIEEKDKYTLIKIWVQKFNSSVAPDLKLKLRELYEKEVKNIILDMSETSYVDSTGLSAFLVAFHLCERSKGLFVSSGLQDRVKELLSIAQLDTIFPVTENLDEAIALFAQEPEKVIQKT